MLKIDTILFDLDGTLTDSGPGIMNGVRYALKRYGMESVEEAELRGFVGPPLQKKFQEFCNISEEEGRRAVSYYREYYGGKGIFENQVYPGIPETLQRLKQKGFRICMATSKPEHYALQIAEYFQIDGYFDFIGGSLMDGRRTKKADVIRYVLQECEVQDKSRVLMVGDREHDILGAKQVGIHSLGVLFGYGSREELEKAGAERIVETPEEIGDFCSRYY